MARVLIHSLVFSPDSVSTAYLMSELSLALKNLGHEVTVLTTTPHYNLDPAALTAQPLETVWPGILYKSSYHGIPVWHVKVPAKGRRMWSRVGDHMWFHVVSLLLGTRKTGVYDIVIATSPPLTIGVVAWLLGRRCGAPSVYKVAEIYPDIAINQGLLKNRLMIRMMQSLERLVYRKSAAVLPIAEQFRLLIQDRAPFGDKLQTVPEFVDTHFFRPLPRDNEFARTFGLLDRFVVLYGGNIGYVQDWESVLQAAENLRQAPVLFAIVGDGVCRSQLVDQVNTRRLNNITVIGYQPKERMPEVNASSEIGLIPMKSAGNIDGCPSKVFSILACAKPVLATAEPRSEIAWMLERGRCGRIATPGSGEALTQAVLRALEQQDLLKQEGENGRRFVEMYYSKEVITARYDKLIRSLTQSRADTGQGQGEAQERDVVLHS